MFKSSNKEYERWFKAFVFLFMIFIVCLLYYILGRDIYKGTRVLYGDDLGSFNFHANENKSVWDKLTTISGNKVRYISRVMYLVFWYLVGDNCERVDILLWGWNILIAIAFLAISMWLLSKVKFYKRCVLALACTTMFAVSRFSYYTFTEAIGIMESFALILAVFLVVLLIKDDFNYGKKFWTACGVYAVIVWVHERYFVLAGVLLLYIFFGIMEQRNVTRFIRKLGVVTGILAFYWGIRFLLLGNRVLDGTGGTDIKETFNFSVFFKHILYQIGYLLGINSPDNEWLNGIDPRYVEKSIYILTILVIGIYFATLVKYLRIKSIRKENVYKILIFYSAIVSMIVASSVTFRVEMRWLYSSYAVLILSGFYMLSVLHEQESEGKNTYIIYTFVMISVICIYLQEGYYRQYWKNLYYWTDRELSSSLVETIGRDKKIKRLTIVSENGVSYWDEETVKDFVAPYNIEIETVDFCSNVYEANGTGWILLKDANQNAFTNISKIGKRIYNISGWDDDGWIEPDTFIEFINMDNSTVVLEFYLPYEVPGSNQAEIFVNGISVQKVDIPNSGFVTTELSDMPLGRAVIEIKCNFCSIENSGRSEEGKLSCVLSRVEIK